MEEKQLETGVIVKAKVGTRQWGVYSYELDKFYPFNYEALNTSLSEMNDIAPQLIMHEESNKNYVFSMARVQDIVILDGLVVNCSVK